MPCSRSKLTKTNRNQNVKLGRCRICAGAYCNAWAYCNKMAPKATLSPAEFMLADEPNETAIRLMEATRRKHLKEGYQAYESHTLENNAVRFAYPPFYCTVSYEPTPEWRSQGLTVLYSMYLLPVVLEVVRTVGQEHQLTKLQSHILIPFLAGINPRSIENHTVASSYR